MGGATTIRKARPGDAAGARALLAELGYPDLPDRAHRELFARAAAHPEADVFVAASGAALLGLLVLTRRPALRLAAEVATIDELVVAAAHRGQGIGRRLLDAAVARARELRCARVELQTRRSRESYVRGFYAARGFVEVDSALLRLELRPGS